MQLMEATLHNRPKCRSSRAWKQAGLCQSRSDRPLEGWKGETPLPLPLSEKRLAGRARRRPGVVIPAAGAIGVLTGVLANGGGFLLVPLFVLVLGLTMPESAGTSLVVISVLSIFIFTASL